MGDDYAPTEIFTGIKKPDMSALEKDEIQMIDRVAKKYGGLNGEQLAQLSHTEAPYASAKLFEEIPYEFSYYRGTDFSDL